MRKKHRIYGYFKHNNDMSFQSKKEFLKMFGSEE